MTIDKIFSTSDKKLKKILKVELSKRGYKTIHNKDKFLYAEGNAPYMLVAHLDTVHKALPSIICYSKDGNHIMSPQGIGGDDRCGVYIILELLKRLPFKPYIVFTMEEETGGFGAYAFADYIEDKAPDLKYIVEYDIKGNNDCVFYDCDNKDFIDFVESFGFAKAFGTFSDISIIAPVLKAAAVNLSSGYYNPHTLNEYVSVSDMNNIIEASVKMLCSQCEGFVYIQKTYQSFSGYQHIYISPVPAGTMYIYDVNTGEYFININGQISVDKDGNLYLFSSLYADYELTNNVCPIEKDFVPKYNPNTAKKEWVYTKPKYEEDYEWI